MNLTDDLTNGIIWKQLTALALDMGKYPAADV